MSKEHVKVGRKLLAGMLGLIILISMMPVSLIAYALGNEYDYLEAKNISARYDSASDSIVVTWDAIQGDFDRYDINIDSSFGDSVFDVNSTTYTFDTASISLLTGGQHTVNLVGKYDTHERTASATVTLPYNLSSVGSINATEVENDLTMAHVVAQMPTTVDLMAESNTVSAAIVWNTEGSTYDKTRFDAQTIDVSGTVTLPDGVINRNSVSLTVSGTVNVAAAIDVDITTDIATTVSKKVDEELSMSVVATGTGLKYQWYKDENKISGATSDTYTIEHVALTNNTSCYYCIVTGKNGTTDQSSTLVLTVSKVDTNVGLSVTPPAQARPGEITLEATGLPSDANGSLVFKAGEKTIGTVSLPAKNQAFNASGANNTYNFSVEYSGDTTKYNGSNDSVNEYSFVKGTQVAEFVAVPTTKTYGDADFTVRAENTENKGSNGFEYTIIDEIRIDTDKTPGGVATIDSATGKVTLINAGTFKVQVKAKADDDYNESEAVSSETITVNRAQCSLNFSRGAATEITYAHDFSITRVLESAGSGTGTIIYSLGSATIATGFSINSKTGEVTYIRKDTDNDKNNDKNVVGTLGFVEVVATKAADNQYAEASASDSFTVNKANQTSFEFMTLNPLDIVYTENNGTTYTNAIGTNEGSVTVNNAVVYSLEAATALEDNVAINVSELAAINDSTGMITAKRSGKLTVKAYRAGNNVYKEIEKTYTVAINRGTIQVGTNGDDSSTGFKFNFADGTVKYGRNEFENTASGGQTDSTQTIYYSEESDEIDVSANGVISFLKKPADAATSEYSVILTATKPETDKYETKSITYTLTVKRDAIANDNFRVNGNEIKDATLITSGDGWYNADYNNITFTPVAPYTKISEDGKEWRGNINITNDAKHDITFYLKDDQGNTTLISSQKVNYDTETANAKLTVVNDNDFWDKFVETITFGLWKKESKQIKIEAADNLSDIASIGYYEQNFEFDDFNKDNIAQATISWNTCNNLTRARLTASETINISLDHLSNKKVVVYVKVTDYAGNTSYFRSNGMIFDNISPTQEVALSDKPIVNIQLATNSEEGLYSGDVPFSLVVKDPKEDASGIKDIKVTITGKESDGTEHSKEINITTFKSATEYYSEVADFDSKNISNSFTVEGSFVLPKEFNSNYISILVEGVDYAGNTFSNSDNPTLLAIDTTNPTIDIAYTTSNGTEDVNFSNEKYIGNNQNRKATITITELNFDNSAVAITLKRDDEKIDIAPTFKAVENGKDTNGDQIKWVMDIDYAKLVIEDGNSFDFDITYTDRAQNRNDAVDYGEYKNPQSFIIDNTKPVISVEITNSDVQNNKFFKADRTATVTIKERFFDENYKFDWDGLIYALSGITGNAPTPVLTSSDDNTYIRVYKVNFTTEGDYTFDVKYTDLADNSANTYGCNSVSYKEFTVDKTAPALVITGLADKSANNGDVIPVISFSDTNYNANGITVGLSGINQGTAKVNGSYSEITNGQTFTFVNFEKTKDNDDIYTMTAKVVDFAGNETTQTITFSVNRFGSVYTFDDSLTGIEGKYVQKEVDVVLTETNVDSLRHETIKLKMTKNGTPTDLAEGTDYTVAENGGNGQWSQYKYTVNKSLFSNDGRYTVTLYSEDAAGNINENIDESKEAEISFGVDKTAPVIVPVDFESDKQYPVESKTVSVGIKDNLVLDGVKIYLNDKEVKFEQNGETYTFEVAQMNSKQNVKFVATDAAGNETPLTVDGFLVSTNLFIRWYNNTPLFVGSLIGVSLLGIGVASLVVFGKKKKKNADK